jgi:hypothetical protein
MLLPAERRRINTFPKLPKAAPTARKRREERSGKVIRLSTGTA